MKSNKNFQKSKKSNSFDNEREMKSKKAGEPSKKKKNLKREIYNELEDFEDLDLFGNKDEFLEDDEDSDN